MQPGRGFVISLAGLALVVTLTAALAATLGFLRVPLHEVATVFSAKALLRPVPQEIDATTISVLTNVRLPRILAAILIGGSLALCGAVFQAVLLNPLADPYTLGISTGAAFGASLVIVLQIFGLALPTAISVPFFAFLGGMGTLALVLYLAAGDSRLSSTSLILAGVIVSAILSAAIGFFKFLADEQVGIIIFWLMGSLAGASWSQLQMLAPVTLVGALLLCIFGRDLNIMAAGERSAASLGIATQRLRLLLVCICSLLTAMAVSVSGIIGFVGLIVPHLLRHLSGPDNRVLLPYSFFAGALLLLAADTLTRAVLPSEVPIGVLTALLGGPFFCFLFKKRQRDGGIF